MTQASVIAAEAVCFHCGDHCSKSCIQADEKIFCCEGCAAVYHLLRSKDLCDYYNLAEKPGISPNFTDSGKWAFLDEPQIAKSLFQFESNGIAVVEFQIPKMHCASCIFLLEKLPGIISGVLSSSVDFLKKKVIIKFNLTHVSLRSLAETLSKIGYTPLITLENGEVNSDKKVSRQLIYKIGIAGFCAGNVMMLSMPEYFDWHHLIRADFASFFRFSSLFLTLPVVFYSGRDYFISAWKALASYTINMDVPLAIGIGGLFIQSIIEIFSGRNGYFDSVTGLLFLLLIGKYIQQKTFSWLSFDRDYKSYFPLSIIRIEGEKQSNVKVTDLAAGDSIFVRHKEIVPADCIVEEDNAAIDYSFVTGESAPIVCEKGSVIYAGGRNVGKGIKLEVVKDVSQSYLTRLWNTETFRKQNKSGLGEQSARLAKRFTYLVLATTVITALFWAIQDPGKILKTTTSILIVACPCVVALTIPFTFGRVLRLFGRNGFYLKSGDVIENLASIDTIVFDKTGTLTDTETSFAEYEGDKLTLEESKAFQSVAAQSTHPVSRIVNGNSSTDSSSQLNSYSELPGKGISGTVGTMEVKIQKSEAGETSIFIDNVRKGAVRVSFAFRKDVNDIVTKLKKSFQLYVASGDNAKDKSRLEKYFEEEKLLFDYKPEDKQRLINRLKSEGKSVAMIGDGLNDAIALMESDFGITITNDTASFTPASDAILDSHHLQQFPDFVNAAKSVKKIINGSFIYTFLYNAIGIAFAAKGMLQPVIAALLMPLSSITVVVYSSLASWYLSKKYNL